MHHLSNLNDICNLLRNVDADSYIESASSGLNTFVVGSASSGLNTFCGLWIGWLVFYGISTLVVI